MNEIVNRTADLAAATPVSIAGNEAEADNEGDALTNAVIAAIRTVRDPEIPLNIYDLGLIYRIGIPDPGHVEIDMTLTAPGCPVAGEIMGWVQKAVEAVESVETVTVKLVFDPPWDQSKMSEAAKLELGLL